MSTAKNCSTFLYLCVKINLFYFVLCFSWADACHAWSVMNYEKLSFNGKLFRESPGSCMLPHVEAWVLQNLFSVVRGRTWTEILVLEKSTLTIIISYLSLPTNRWRLSPEVMSIFNWAFQSPGNPSVTSLNFKSSAPLPSSATFTMRSVCNRCGFTRSSASLCCRDSGVRYAYRNQPNSGDYQDHVGHLEREGP